MAPVGLGDQAFDGLRWWKAILRLGWWTYFQPRIFHHKGRKGPPRASQASSYDGVGRHSRLSHTVLNLLVEDYKYETTHRRKHCSRGAKCHAGT